MSPRSRLPDVLLPVSRTRIDAAGDILRRWWLDDDEDTPLIDEIRDAVRLMLDFRAGFQDPLNRVTMGLRSFVKTEGAPVIVAQRLKRAVTITDKLGRLPTVRLTQMQDIAGCRAIVPSQRHAYDVGRRIRRTGWEVRRVDGYARDPRSTGYRAVHVVVRRRGRLVEIQLRTPLQQRWAAEVDRGAGFVGLGLKEGAGPPELVSAFRELGDEIAQSGGDAARRTRLDEGFQRIREQILSFRPAK